MKKEIADFVSRCLTYQQVKAKHQKPAGKIQPLPIPVWKWDKITMDFVTGLPRTWRQHDAIWVIVDRLTKSAHFLPVSNDDPLDKLAQLYVEEIVRLHGVLRFGRRGKLRPKYIGPYEIIAIVGPVAYRLDLPPELSKVHNVFHVSMLRKYILDLSHVLRDQPLELKDNLTYKEQPMQIVDRREQILRNKVILLVKVLWGNHGIKEATWESEAQMRSQYPQLFSD